MVENRKIDSCYQGGNGGLVEMPLAWKTGGEVIMNGGRSLA
jgi:hypothetical protein